MNKKINKKINRQIDTKFGAVLLIVLAAIVSAYVIFGSKSISFPYLPSFPPWFHIPSVSELKDIEKFSSEEDFKAYLAEVELGYTGGFAAMGAGRAEISIAQPMALESAEGKGAIPERVSETTVQVLGIDEPDIVKTDGKEIYFSSGQSYYYKGSMDYRGEMMPPRVTGDTKAIKAFPPEDLAIEGKIDKQGDLLLDKNILVIFSGQDIYGYDVSNPKQPQEKWKVELEDNNYLVSARLFKNKIYLVSKTRIDTYHPCPIRPLSVKGVPLEIKCIDIYHPRIPIPIDVTYNALVLDPKSGEVENTVSFVGSSDGSVVYMSKNGIYITYSYYESIIKFFYNFFNEDCRDIIPTWVIEKLKKLDDYDISDAAKFMEFQIIFERYQSSLSDDERMRIENEFTNRMADYYKKNKRDLEKTGLVKIELEKFKFYATGSVPGKPLNQFSLDEYKNHLRIATTIGEGWGMFGSMGESANDVYVLDKTLEIAGSVKDLGISEKIYSVRFIEDKGYLVTFKQIDPFFVLDLSKPKKPELKGELKIPGYSSYLHPLTKDKILGIGKEGSKVKISLFDVSLPEKPVEKDKYILKEYWSDILNTHHAFLLDSKHEIFFLPGSRGGYVFSYKNDSLELKRAVSNIRARRAIYIDDFFYIIGDNKMVVLSEINWEKVNEIEFSYDQ